jgi:hypothetical protein
LNCIESIARNPPVAGHEHVRPIRQAGQFFLNVQPSVGNNFNFSFPINTSDPNVIRPTAPPPVAPSSEPRISSTPDASPLN